MSSNCFTSYGRATQQSVSVCFDHRDDVAVMAPLDKCIFIYWLHWHCHV